MKPFTRLFCQLILFCRHLITQKSIRLSQSPVKRYVVGFVQPRTTAYPIYSGEQEMKLRFYRSWYNDAKRATLARAMSLELINANWEKKWREEWRNNEPDHAVISAMARENALAKPYSTYLASSLESDFPAYRSEHYEEVLQEIDRLERGEIDSYETGGDGFCHSLTRTHVVFEHTVFGECLEWPRWTCRLEQYKAALQGWKQFLQLPESIGSELIVELPETKA